MPYSKAPAQTCFTGASHLQGCVAPGGIGLTLIACTSVTCTESSTRSSQQPSGDNQSPQEISRQLPERSPCNEAVLSCFDISDLEATCAECSGLSWEVHKNLYIMGCQAVQAIDITLIRPCWRKFEVMMLAPSA